jgi:predicted ribosome quality control (RQC) complex YloA/Tae2 family protein
MLNLDYFFLERLVTELVPQVTGASLTKVHQPADECLILRLWNGRQSLKLLIQVGQGARLHLTRQEFPNPFQPPRFCQLLRARLKRLESISLPVIDRVVEICFSGEDQPYRLMCELTGVRSNLYLLDAAGLLIDALHKPDDTAERQLRRGQPYSFPPRKERQSLATPGLTPPTTCVTADDFEIWLRQLSPMSKYQNASLTQALQQNESSATIFNDFVASWQQKTGTAALVDFDGRQQLVAYLPAGVEAIKSTYQDLSCFIDECFSPLQQPAGEIGERASFRRLITNYRSRLLKRQKNIAHQQQQGESFAQRRQLGELLLSNLHLVEKGAQQVEVTDWSCTPPARITIPLKPELSPQQNAAQLFKRYKKEKRGVDHIERRQQETATELTWLDNLLLALDEATSRADLNEIGQELRTAGLLKSSKSEPKNRYKSPTQPTVHQAFTPGGLRLFWGRNNRSNDYLSATLTEGDDLWFHAQNMPGCHLVLKRDGRKGEFPEEDILFAAEIAAGYSRGRNAAKVEVMVTQGRNVSRPRGARPGLVTVSEYRALIVAPRRLDDEENQG